MERTDEIQYRKPASMVTSIIDWLHEKHIYELAVTRMSAFERTASALEKRRGQQNVVVDTTFVLSESLTEIVRAIKTLAMKQADAEEEEMLVTVGRQWVG
jgi:hypothetical protein